MQGVHKLIYVRVIRRPDRGCRPRWSESSCWAMSSDCIISRILPRWKRTVLPPRFTFRYEATSANVKSRHGPNVRDWHAMKSKKLLYGDLMDQQAHRNH